MPEPKLLIATDGTIRINDLKDEDTGAVINTATITVAIFKEVPLLLQQTLLAFNSGGTYEMVVGDVILGATGGATAVITAINVITGTFGGGNAAGNIFLRAQIGTFQAENINLADGSEDDIATIAADSTGAESVAAGAKTKFISIDHGLTINDHVRLQGSYSYDEAWDIDVLDTKDKFTLPISYVAEKFDGNEKVYVGLRGGWGITLASTGSGGNYKGTVPDTVKKLIKNSYYLVFFTIMYGAFNITLVKRWEAEYYEGE